MIDVVCVTPSAGGGWAPVTSMAELAATCFGGTLKFTHPQRDYTRLHRAASLIPRLRRSGSHGRHLLLIAARPSHLLSLVGTRAQFGAYESVSAWIFDAFWDEEMPRMARRTNFVDHFFVTESDLVAVWHQPTNTPTTWLPWGTDTLSVDPGTFAEPRPYDVLRLGRQPVALADDASTESTLAELGLRFHGSPPIDLDDGAANSRQTWLALRQSRVVLASSNLSSPATYTHPTREYVTARWCDASAAGTIVAGVAPKTESAKLLPASGLHEIPIGDLSAAAAALPEVVKKWSPELARSLHHHARRTLDWRHRFKVIADTLGENLPELQRQLSHL